jgi:hypothetical protein
MRRLELVKINDNCVEFTGYGARELHTQSAGRPPVWNTRTRRWVTSPRRVPNLVALAELRGWEVLLDKALQEDFVVTPSGLPDSKTAMPVFEQADPGRGLW